MYNFKQNNGALEYIRMGGRGVGDSLSDVRQRSSQWHPPPLGFVYDVLQTGQQRGFD